MVQRAEAAKCHSITIVKISKYKGLITWHFNSVRHSHTIRRYRKQNGTCLESVAICQIYMIIEAFDRLRVTCEC